MAEHNHFTFKSIIDSLGVCSNENINSGAILSFDVVCVGSPVIIMLQKKVKCKYKEKLGILSREEKKLGKQGRLPTPADILVNI